MILSANSYFFVNYGIITKTPSRPANILLTAGHSPVPVLVDFGFAEKYDPRSSKAFLSNLAYGTPEVC